MMNENEIIKKETMTSVEIAKVTGKRHDNVVRDIQNILKQGVDALNFEETSYTDRANRQQKYYMLTKKGCLILASGYDALLREKIINRWEELETKNMSAIKLPTTFAEALRLAADQAEKLEVQEKQLAANSKEIVELSGAIATMQPKVTYVDKIFSSKETVTTTQIAQDYGLSAKSFNILLRNFGIQHKVGGQWIPYVKFLPNGYVQSDTIPIEHKDGSSGSVMHTKWTQKERLFLYEELKKHNVLPLIEK